MVGEPGGRSAGESFGVVNLSPLLKQEVRGGQSGAALVALVEHLEEQLGPGFRQRHEALVIDNEQLVAGNLLLKAEQILLAASFDQLVDQRGSCGEAHMVSMLTRGRYQT